VLPKHLGLATSSATRASIAGGTRAGSRWPHEAARRPARTSPRCGRGSTASTERRHARGCPASQSTRA